MKLIDKDALVAEIESYKNSFCDRNGYLEDSETNGLAYDTLCELEDSIDSLEVKEVDLNEEIDNYISDNFFGSETLGFFAVRTKEEPNDIDMALCARYFFELGLKVNYPTTASDRGTAEEIIINLKRVEHDYRINLTKEIEWVRNQVKKGSKGMTEIKAEKCYMCLREIKGYESFTKGKVYPSLYDNALINDNHVEVVVMPGENFRIATEQEIKAQKGE